MLDQPQVVQTTSRPAAVIRLTIPREEMRNVMGPAIGELMATIAKQGIAPAPNLWECYVAGPESSADPAEWRTEFYRPLVG